MYFLVRGNGFLMRMVGLGRVSSDELLELNAPARGKMLEARIKLGFSGLGHCVMVAVARL